MNDLQHVSELHHAYIIVGDSKNGTSEVLSLLQSRGISTSANPDVRVERYDEMSVDDARDTLQSFASLKPLGDKKYLIISFSSANHNAQNALLKIVEESPGKTLFFFCVDQIGSVLPTLRSRCIIVQSSHSRKEAEHPEAKLFLRSTYAERLSLVEKMSTTATKTQEREPVREFVRALISLSSKQSFSGEQLRDLLDADRYLKLSGASSKVILSHLAVTLPRM